MKTDEAVAAGTLLQEAVDALGRVDAERLRVLAERSSAACWPESIDEQCVARERRAVLQKLLVLTRRNLQLLRGASVQAEGYGERLR